LVTDERQILMPVMSIWTCSVLTRRECCRAQPRPYRVPYALREEMRNQLGEMMRKRVITPCALPWGAPVILVPKKSADGTPKYRVCTDFRGLNSATSIPVYPIPDIKSNLSLTAGSNYLTLLDIENA